MTGRTFEEVYALAEPREEEVTLCLAGGLSTTADRLVAQLDMLDRTRTSLADGEERARLAKELEEVRELMKSAEVTFRFRAMPSKQYSDLLAAHPGAEGRALNVATLQPDLIAQSSLEPKMTREQVDLLLDRLNEWQRDRLFDAAWNANNAAVAIPISRVASVSPSLSGAS